MSRSALELMLAALLAVLTGCNLPQASPPPINLQATVAAQAQATLNAQGGSALTPLPPSTTLPSPAAPAASPTPSPTARPTNTPSPAPARLSVSVDTNCRKGPGEPFERVGVLFAGQKAEVLGQSTVGNYWVVRLPNGKVCWIWGQYATVTGNRPFPPMTPPPTPGLATVKGRVFHDSNRNGRQDAGEAPFVGLTVWLMAATGGQCSGPTLAQTTTNAQGDYHLQAVPATYCVALPGGPPWCAYGVNGAPQGGSVVTSLHAGQVLTLDFGDIGCSPYDPSCTCP